MEVILMAIQNKILVYSEDDPCNIMHNELRK